MSGEPPIRSAQQWNMPHGAAMVEVVTAAGVTVSVYVSPAGRSVRVFKRKPGKRAHQMKVIDG